MCQRLNTGESNNFYFGIFKHWAFKYFSSCVVLNLACLGDMVSSSL